ncbi:MAG: nuclear transport factor 2 family protein [Candidatus Saccharimonadaceae bacterium]
MKSNLKEIVEKADEAFAHNKPEDFLSLCADQIVWRMVGESTVEGKDEVRKWMTMGMDYEGEESAPPKIHISNIIEENNCVIAYGEMELAKKNEVDQKYNYCDIYRFLNDKIIELTSYVIPSEL